MLAAVLINTQALKDQPLCKVRLQGADLKDRVYMQLGGTHGRQVLLHATPHD